MDALAERFSYPERIREAFLAEPGLTFGDGTTLGADAIWRFMTEEGPRRFPSYFTIHPQSGRMSPDVDFFPGIKRYYWLYTGFDRFKRRQRDGWPVVAVQAATPLELFHAADWLIASPGFPLIWQLQQTEGLSFEEQDRRLVAIRNECKKCMPAECCTLVAPFHAVHVSAAPVDFVASFTMTSCSDAAFAMETARRPGRNIPSFVVDFPVNAEAGPWRIDYLAAQLRELADRLGDVGGKPITAAALATQIKRQNQLRRLGRACTELWWNAPVPPTNSADRFLGVASADSFDHPVAMQLLKESKAEIERRIAGGVLGAGLQPDPLRLLVCGSCAYLNSYMVENAGGVVVGSEQLLSSLFTEVAEEGDPFRNLAEALCRLPYERPPAERAAWAAKTAQAARADGVIFIHNWGCNFQSAIARTMTEIIRRDAGIPTLILDISYHGLMATTEQIRTRVEAFVESLRRPSRTAC